MVSWNSFFVKVWEYRPGVNVRKQNAQMKKFNKKEGRNLFKFILILISKNRLKHQTKIVK
jgi:hypothetical protein